MKKDKHPKYQQVLFVDSATNHAFVCGSSLQTEERQMFEGKEYPVYRVSVSSASHPFFTGSNKFVDSEGRVDKFKKRYIQAQPKEAAPEAAPEPTKKKAKSKAK